MELIKYEPKYLEQLLRLFDETIHAVNRSDYTDNQLNAWADGSYNRAEWNSRLLSSYTVIAVCGEKVCGFGSAKGGNEIDLLYVHKDFQRKGVATLICNDLEQHCKIPITVWASITAKGFFLKRGYVTEKENIAVRHGVELKNYKMKKLS